MPERSRRESKRAALDDDFITDEMELRKVSKAKPDLRKVKTKKRTLRPESTEHKPKKKTVAEEMESRYLAEAAKQNEVDNKLIAKMLALRIVEPVVGLSTTSDTCKSVSQGITKSFREAGVCSMLMALRDSTFEEHYIGNLCQVFYEVLSHTGVLLASYNCHFLGK